MSSFLFPLLVLVIGGFFFIPIFTRKERVRKQPPPTIPFTQTPQEPQFMFYNYLKKTVRVEAISTAIGRITPITVATIPGRSSKGVNLSLVEKYLASGNTFQIVIVCQNTEKVFSHYTLDVCNGEMIKELHIGMMVSKWVGATNDYSVGKNGGTAVQGAPWLRMHNLTSLPLAFNENINITPEGVLRYTGRYFNGVALGTEFVDQDDLFPSFILNIPATDLYIGVTSDLKQGLYGGFQLTPEFYHDEGAPNDMQQLDNLTGPDVGHIAPGYLPIEGPSVTPVNRWGESK